MAHKRPGRTAKRIRKNRLKERLKKGNPRAAKLLRDIFEGKEAH
jgi:hypothetical protein